MKRYDYRCNNCKNMKELSVPDYDGTLCGVDGCEGKLKRVFTFGGYIIK